MIQNDAAAFTAFENKESPSYKQLVSDLLNIGIGAGDTVVVHSSMKSMGYVEGGAECVIAALADVVGTEGTLMFPTFTFATSYGDSFFSNKDTPSCVINQNIRICNVFIIFQFCFNTIGCKAIQLDSNIFI